MTRACVSCIIIAALLWWGILKDQSNVTHVDVGLIKSKYNVSILSTKDKNILKSLYCPHYSVFYITKVSNQQRTDVSTLHSLQNCFVIYHHQFQHDETCIYFNDQIDLSIEVHSSKHKLLNLRLVVGNKY